jgi:RNA ligase (TIGR02306 family)
MRQMATPRKIRDIQPIPGADQIEVLTIDGWKVVAKKGLHEIGEMVIYLEVDSWVPNTIAPFLSKGNEPREYQGVPGERLRTVKLRGQISQGLVIPYSVLSPAQKDEMFLGTSLDEVLGILKWEPPVFEGSNPLIKGPFPYFVPKTDQERVQNLTEEYQIWRLEDDYWEVTEKLDGYSMTVFINGDHVGVASRNNELKPDSSSAFWQAVNRESLLEKIASTGRNLAFQGELIGPKIQGNKYDRDVAGFFVYDIYDIDARSYLGYKERFELCRELAINHVPVQATDRLCKIVHENDDLIELADWKSSLAKVEREGLVFKRYDGTASFKVISNTWLLKNE